MTKKKPKDENQPICVLLPRPLREMLRQKAVKEDLTFSQLVRRAVRKEVGCAEVTH